MTWFGKKSGKKSDSPPPEPDYGALFQRLWDQLVPESGQAETVQGEVIRAIGRMGDEYSRNGCCNWDSGYVILSNFLLQHLTDGSFGPTTSAGIRADIDGIQSYARGDQIKYDLDGAHERLMRVTVAWCQKHPEPIPHIRNEELKR